MANTFTIKKSFHFHAAHRNEDLIGDKCFSIHGHTYFLDCYFQFEKPDEDSITMLFADIKNKVLPVIDEFEHSFIINKSDPFYELLKDKEIKLCVLDYPSSAENLAKTFFDRISQSSHLDLVQVDFKETNSSIVIYKKNKLII